MTSPTELTIPQLDDVPEDDAAEPLDAGCPDDPSADDLVALDHEPGEV